MPRSCSTDGECRTWQIRGIAFAQVEGEEILFVASEDLNAVLGFATDGHVAFKLPLMSPVGVYYDNLSQILYAGSNNGKSSSVVAFSTASGSLPLVRTYAHSTMTHPAGLAVYDGVLYVADQDGGKIR